MLYIMKIYPELLLLSVWPLCTQYAHANAVRQCLTIVDGPVEIIVGVHSDSEITKYAPYFYSLSARINRSRTHRVNTLGIKDLRCLMSKNGEVNHMSFGYCLKESML